MYLAVREWRRHWLKPDIWSKKSQLGLLPNMTSAATNRLIEPSLTYCKTMLQRRQKADNPKFILIRKI